MYEECDNDLIPLNKTNQRDLTEILESVFPGATTEIKAENLIAMSGTKTKVHDMGKIIIVDKSKSSKLPASKERRKHFFQSGQQMRKYKNDYLELMMKFFTGCT